jgi:hypothetical protein
VEGQAKSGHDGLCTRPNHATDEPYAAFYQHGIDISYPVKGSPPGERGPGVVNAGP